jgi:hypothetical protein
LAAAVSYDDQFQPKKTKRQVFCHDTIHDSNLEDNNDDLNPIFDIDLRARSIQAYATNYRNKQLNIITSKIRMSSEKWYSLKDKSRAIYVNWMTTLKLSYLAIMGRIEIRKKIYY